MSEDERAAAPFNFVDQLRANLPTLTITVPVAIYVTGFVALNSYLAKFGVTEQDLLHPRIITAGVLFMLHVATFAVFAGQATLAQSENDQNILPRIHTGAAHVFWTNAARIYKTLNVGVALCCSSALFVSIFVVFDDAFFFLGALSTALCFKLIFTARSLSAEQEEWLLLAKILGRVILILIYAVSVAIHGLGSPLGTTLLSYGALFGALGIALVFGDTLSNRRVFFVALYFPVAAVSFAALFGTVVFPDIRASFGGGQSRPAVVEFVQPPASLGNPLAVHLMHESDDYIVFSRAQQVFRVRADNISVMRVENTRPENFLALVARTREFFGLPPL